MKVLLVTYTPRGAESSTKAIVDYLKSNAKNAQIEELDLLADRPDFFDNENIVAYSKRNYGGMKLDESESKSIAKMDRMTAQFKSADVVVVAYPMYNFSLPGIVKTYFDSVMLKGETWDMKEGKFIGLQTDKKAVIISSYGGDYSDNHAWEHATSLAKIEFQFMGFAQIEEVVAQGMNMYDKDKKEKILNDCKSKIDEIIKEWSL